ncbi:hypothetical protein GWO43_08250 [candidate division KSB1 bacterium]|nr:hypothetical protein [candidate division KSB1 bacterium]NIR72614.1 hypothetical protein [candidate division KSB1 bacterium]NIS23668.1 hypothetical protein [candidate division KSB1 bacterium]NIT70878.1 hypothetical protein [candidate division KSB1 bacterium]NIU24310.1 hypothetical protein [candidate division KSB1 bacterium]
MPFNTDSLKQVLLNLTINSIQAMPEGGRLPVNVQRDADLIKLDITDTRVGIAEKHL